MRLLVLVLVVACGASPPAPPARPTTAAGTIELLEAAATRACACSDASCALTVEAELETGLAGLPTFLDDPAFARGDAAVQRGITCLWAHEVVGYAYAEVTLSATTWARDQTCACADTACLRAISDRVANRALHLQAVPKSEAMTTALSSVVAASNACTAELVERVPAIRDLLALRSRACACAGNDRACGAEVGSAVLVWSKQYETAVVAGAEAVRLKALSVELGKCLGKTGWTFPS